MLTPTSLAFRGVLNKNGIDMQNIQTLRGRLKKNFIRYKSVKRALGSNAIRNIHVTMKVLFRSNAPNYDDLQNDLIEEGWLFPDENLLDIIMEDDPQLLRRGKVTIENESKSYLTPMEKELLDDYSPQSPEDLIPLRLIV